MFKKFFFGLVAALLFSGAHAATYYKWFPQNAPTASQPRFQTPEQACTYFVTVIWGLPGPGSAVIQDASTYNCRDNGGGARGQAYREIVSLTCTPPLVAKFTGSGSSATWTCETTACPVGVGRTFNRTEGWARSPDADADDLVVDNGPPSFYGYNDGVCVGDIARVEMCYRSQEPSAQGLYRTSCDYTMVNSGEASPGTGDDAAKPTDPIAACPGTLGTVNGKPLCVGTAASPLPPGTAPPNSPTAAGNPSAGLKPESGEGSGNTGAGRTPSTGSGGNTGGPAGAAVGRGGTGDRGEPGEDATAVCGAPPLPACAVKVDETGVPAEGTAAGRFGDANTNVDGTQSDAEGFLEGIADITLPSWSWTFSFPTGCTPLVLPAFDDFEIDVCQFQPMIHDLMSVLWVIAGIWGLINLFMRASGVS